MLTVVILVNVSAFIIGTIESVRTACLCMCVCAWSDVCVRGFGLRLSSAPGGRAGRGGGAVVVSLHACAGDTREQTEHRAVRRHVLWCSKPRANRMLVLHCRVAGPISLPVLSACV